MAHTLPILVEKDTYAKFNTCIHCGLCLPACPTYVETLSEADSPRGRIHLMKAAVDGRVAPSAVILEHLDKCLICRACETACPSGVEYHALVEAVRPQVAAAVNGRAMGNPLLQWMVSHVLPYPKRVALAMLPLRAARRLGLGGLAGRIAARLPAPMADMTAMLPEGSMAGKPATFTPALPPHRGSVVLLLGCVGSAVSGELNQACVNVLTQNGFDVHVLADEPCCGAMAAHANAPEAAREFGRRMVDVLGTMTPDYFISPIAGCGAQVKELEAVLAASRTYREKARGVATKTRDICEFLDEVGIRPPTGRIEKTVTYHDPCHLLNVQRVSEAPRRLLRLIPGLTLVPLAENDLCCGAAGTYNLSQPAMARSLGQRKAGNIRSTGATICATANVGCELHIRRNLLASGASASVTVEHVIMLLAASYRLSPTAGERPGMRGGDTLAAATDAIG